MLLSTTRRSYQCLFDYSALHFARQVDRTASVAGNIADAVHAYRAMKQVPKSVPGDRRVRAVEITPDGLELFDAAHVAAEPLADEAESLTDLLTQFTSHAEE